MNPDARDVEMILADKIRESIMAYVYGEDDVEDAKSLEGILSGVSALEKEAKELRKLMNEYRLKMEDYKKKYFNMKYFKKEES